MALRLFEIAGQAPPAGLFIRCENRIPPGSGLGSSAAAALCGLVGANALLDRPLSNEILLELAVECEGHPDNAAAALFGGLVISASLDPGIALSRVEPPPLQIALAVPHFELPTRVARQALPGQVGLHDAVFNIGRTALVVEALRAGDLELLGKVMHDRLHQPFRLHLIPGAESAIQAARQAGAAAVALSGAGPSLVAFARQDHDRIAQAMCSAFRTAGLDTQAMVIGLSPRGTHTFDTPSYPS
jgi:homoserine kinase